MNKYIVYIPKYIADDYGEPKVRADNLVFSIVEEIVRECGGATTQDGYGWWMNGERFSSEPVLICTVYSKEFNYKRIAASIQLQMNQRSVLIVENDTVHFL
jgi:hypothetical protein